jgi:[acyl-carrier-protein] S-malonyltransferase
MGRDVAATSPKAREVYDRANDILGFDLANICFEGPAERLEQTDIQQPAIFVTSVAIWEAWRKNGGGVDSLTHAGGLSLGEYTALHAAGVLSFDDGLRLVRRRGELMQEAARRSPSGMVSLVGADEATARKLCESARGDEVLAPANFNCPGQVVIAGGKAACQRAMGLAEKFGVKGVPLAVAGAFHSAYMEPAAAGLAAVLRETSLARPRMNVIANVNAEYHGDAESIRKSLTRQVTHPVLWQRCMERLIADGVGSFVEIGPGRVLTGLLRKIDRNLKGVNISTAEAVAGDPQPSGRAEVRAG